MVGSVFVSTISTITLIKTKWSTHTHQQRTSLEKGTKSLKLCVLRKFLCGIFNLFSWLREWKIFTLLCKSYMHNTNFFYVASFREPHHNQSHRNKFGKWIQLVKLVNRFRFFFFCSTSENGNRNEKSNTSNKITTIRKAKKNRRGQLKLATCCIWYYYTMFYLTVSNVIWLNLCVCANLFFSFHVKCPIDLYSNVFRVLFITILVDIDISNRQIVLLLIPINFKIEIIKMIFLFIFICCFGHFRAACSSAFLLCYGHILEGFLWFSPIFGLETMSEPHETHPMEE